MKDIILLAMSTLPREAISADDFSTPKADVKDCRSQLESVVRYFVNASQTEDVLILGLCTALTLEAEVSYRKGAEAGRTLKAWDYFKERLLLSPEARGKQLHFEPVRTDENQPAPAVKEMIRLIRDNWETGSHLFVSNNGGLRNLYLFLSAILSLLEHEGIKPDQIMGTEYNSRKRVIDQAGAFDMFAFVTGMNDLIETGDADVLDRFFGGSDQPEYVRAIVTAMRDVACGTQLCDPDLYEQGLDALEPAIEAFEDSGADSLLGIFVDQIREDYGVLLKKDERTPVDIIAWCVRKKLYQQALTFLESRMPAYFYQIRLYYYEPVFNTDISRRKAVFESQESYVFDKLLQKCGFGAGVGHGEGREEFLAIRYYAGEQVKLKNGRSFEPPADFRKESRLPAVFSDWKRNKAAEAAYKLVPADGLFWTTALPEACWPRAGHLLRMHRALKTCRNIFNHGVSEGRPRLGDIKNVLEQYLDASAALAALCTGDRRRQAEAEARLEAEGAPAAAAPEEVKYFINFSNHPSKNEKGEPVWNERQIKAAEKYGPILDIPFPPVPGAASDGTIKKMARESVALILEKNPAAVMCQGEFTLSYAVIKGLLEEGVTVLAACAERNTYEQDGKRITEFEFVKFRKYR